MRMKVFIIIIIAIIIFLTLIIVSGNRPKLTGSVTATVPKLTGGVTYEINGETNQAVSNQIRGSFFGDENSNYTSVILGLIIFIAAGIAIYRNKIKQ